MPQARPWPSRIVFPPLRALTAALYPMRVSGRAQVPASGPYIVVANQTNSLDPPVLEFALGVGNRILAPEAAYGPPVRGDHDAGSGV